MFFFSMLQDGARGVHLANLPEPVDEPLAPEELDHYGVDWDALNDQNIMNHHRQHNPQEYPSAQNAFNRPPSLSDVPCEAPDCPFTVEQLTALNTHLFLHCDLQSRSMVVRRQIWITALEYCDTL